MAQQAQSLPSINPLYRRQIVEQATGYSRSTIYRKINNGLFTKPVNLGTDRSGNACQVAWPANEVQAIINARIAGSDDDAIKALVVELHEKRKTTQSI